MAEIEVKAKVENFQTVLDKLKEIGCVTSDPVVQKDTNYIRNGLEYKNVNRDFTPVLRVREEKDKTTFTIKYNRYKDKALDMVENEVVVSDAATIKEMIKIMDCGEVMKINKTRIKAKYKNYEICLDQVETLGSFIEIETFSENEGGKVQEELMCFLVSLGVDPKNRVFTGYDEMILKQSH